MFFAVYISLYALKRIFYKSTKVLIRIDIDIDITPKFVTKVGHVEVTKRWFVKVAKILFWLNK